MVRTATVLCGYSGNIDISTCRNVCESFLRIRLYYVKEEEEVANGTIKGIMHYVSRFGEMISNRATQIFFGAIVIMFISSTAHIGQLIVLCQITVALPVS